MALCLGYLPIYLILTQNKNDNEVALKNSGYKAKLIYKTMDETSDVCNRRCNWARKIWFIPPYDIAIANKSGKEFFRLLKKNFTLLINLYKIFNKNNIKLSYSCMPNVANLINKSNSKKTQE